MIFDIVVLVILLISALISFLRGFIRETLTIIGVVGGIAAAYFAAPFITPYFDQWLGVTDAEDAELFLGVLPYPLLSQILAYGLVFIFVVLILSFISHVLAESIKSLGLGAIDRSLGVFFGLARGVVMLILFYMPFYFILGEETKARLFEDSRIYFYLEQATAEAASYIPQETVENLEKETKAKSGRLEKILNQRGLSGSEQPSGETPDADNLQKNSSEGGEGYSDNFRQSMDQLFLDQTDDVTADDKQQEKKQP